MYQQGVNKKELVEGTGTNCSKIEYKYIYEEVETKLYKTIDIFTKENYPHTDNAHSKYETIAILA